MSGPERRIVISFAGLTAPCAECHGTGHKPTASTTHYESCSYCNGRGVVGVYQLPDDGFIKPPTAARGEL